MAMALRNFYCEPAAEHYSLDLSSQRELNYCHFVFPERIDQDSGHETLVFILDRLIRPDESLLLDYHHHLCRRGLESLCRDLNLSHLSGKGSLSILLPTPQAISLLSGPIKNEDDLIVRFVHSSHADSMLKDQTCTSVESLLQSIDEHMRAVAFLSLNPFDLEFVASDRTPDQVERIANDISLLDL